MRIALYARVSTSRQAQAQTIEQPLERLRAHITSQGEVVDEHAIFRDAGYSGASLSRPGLDHLREPIRRWPSSTTWSSLRRIAWRASTCTKSCSWRNSRRMAAASSLLNGP